MAKEVEVWKERFAKTRFPKLAKALTAFNANVDAVVLGLGQVNKLLSALPREDLEMLDKKSDAETFQTSELRDDMDFFAWLMHCVKTGKASLVYADKRVLDWFEHVVTPDEKRIGGQAAIMANQLAAFNDFVLAYSSLLSPMQAGFFNQKVCFPTTKGSKLVCHPSKKVARPADPTKVNWIFEFKTGEKLHGFKEYSSPRANRLIVMSNLHYTPLFENVDLKQLGKSADVAFLAGFQYLHHDKKLQELLNKITSQIKILQNSNKKLVVHWEFVPMEDKKAEKQVLLSLAKPIQSFGLNEVELAEVLQMLGAKKEAEAIKKNENAFTLYEGCRKLMNLMKLERVHMHSFGYQLLVLKNPYPVLPDKAREALVFSSIVVALKALKGSGFVTKKEFDSQAHSLFPSETGFNQLRALEGGIDEERVKRHSSFDRRALLEGGVFDLKDHYVLIVPAPIVQPKSTVGLGDIISSMSLAAERG